MSTMLTTVTFRATSFGLRRRLTRCLNTRTTPPPLIEDLNSRGLVAQVTSPLTVYLGVDPTARSLHAGNLLALMGLLHFHIRGHSVIALIGGATGLIGDPGGRSTERPLLSQETLQTNVNGITAQAHRFFENASLYAAKRLELNSKIQPPVVLNNIEWFQGMGLLEFLRTVGKHARVNVMIGRDRLNPWPRGDSVKNRLDSEHGISFTEFSYQLLQAYDFYLLNRKHNCRVQLGGSDQWGNIVSGIDLIRRRQDAESPEDSAREVFGLTIPLLLTSSGAKFGKSAGNAVWLDSSLTSYFDLYQFFIQISDEDAVKYLRMFTLLSHEELDAVVATHKLHPERRSAQRRLAAEVLELVHGEDAVRQAQAATNVLFGATPSERTTQPKASDVIKALHSDPRLKFFASREDIMSEPVTKLAAQVGLTRSRGEARKTLLAGGFYVNNIRVSDDRSLTESDLVDGRIVILRTGKDNHAILAIE
ncbi:hypothetical protein DL93DRAFT_2202917 [Clavulina sp. PMI_390]|nr:hypothetical protein DL93DRAFT_2202917 [Clavulina sp. PMI_390]